MGLGVVRVQDPVQVVGAGATSPVTVPYPTVTWFNGSITPDSGAATNVVALINPNGSGIFLYVKRFSVVTNIVGTSQGILLGYSTGALPSAGTVLTPVQHRFGNDAAPGAVIRRGPTATQAAGTNLIGEIPMITTPFDFVAAFSDSGHFIIPPNNAILLSTTATLAGANFFFNMRVDEAAA